MISNRISLANGYLTSASSFFLFLNHPFDLAQALGNWNTLGANVRAPPQGFAAPDTVITIDFFEPLIRGGIAGVEDVSKSAQQGRRSDIIRIRTGNGT